MTYIIIIGVFQALLTLLLIYISKRKRPAQLLMGGLMIIIFAHLSIKFIIYGIGGSAVLQKSFNTFIDLAYGPMFWMIARKIKDDSFSPLKYWYLFLPLLLAAIVYFGIIMIIVVTGKEPVTLISNYNAISLIGIILSLSISSLAAKRIGFRLNDFWRTEKILLRNVSYLFLFSTTIVTAIYILRFFFNALGDSLIIGGRIGFYCSLILVCVEILRYLLVSRSEGEEITEQNFLPVALQPPAETTLSEEHKKTALTVEQQQSLVHELEQTMLAKELYKDPDLNLEKLSGFTNISRHHISEALNQYGGKTFYQFLNEYRIKEVLYLLNKYKGNDIRPNILSLAFAVGFNSKSSFNQYFKKYTGFTPTEYLKNDAVSILKNDSRSDKMVSNGAAEIV